MGFLKTLFGGRDLSPEEEQQEKEQKNFELLKYDGVRALKTGQTDYAVRCLAEALKVRPDDLETHDYLAQALLRQGHAEQALAEYELLVRAEPSNVGLLVQAANVAFILEDYDRMGTLCQQALATEPNNPQVHYLAGRAHLGQHAAGTAPATGIVSGIAMLTRAIALKPDYVDAYLLRGQTLLQMGDTKGAAADAEWLTAHVQPHEAVLLLKARVEAALGNSEAAEAVYGLVIELNPFCTDAYRERGGLRYRRGDKQGAEQDLQQVVELDPGQLADVSGEYSAEGIEQRVKQAYSAINPLGL